MTDLMLTDEDVKALASEALQKRMGAIMKTLESVENASLPKIHFKSGFRLSEDGDEVKSFQAIIVYAKNSNAWYKGSYDPRSPAPPSCASSNGLKPTHGDEIQADSCKKCPRNSFRDGKKDCKNMKVLFLRFKGGLFPKMLSIPPTSIKSVDNYLMHLVEHIGKSYTEVLTKFEVFKKDPKQTHYNIRLSFVEPLDENEAKDTMFIEYKWSDYMKGIVEEKDNEKDNVPF